MAKSEMHLHDTAFIGPALLFLDQYFNSFIDEYIVLWIALVSMSSLPVIIASIWRSFPTCCWHWLNLADSPWGWWHWGPAWLSWFLSRPLCKLRWRGFAWCIVRAVVKQCSKSSELRVLWRSVVMPYQEGNVSFVVQEQHGSAFISWWQVYP